MSSDVAELERQAGSLPNGWREVVLSDVAKVNPDTLRASTAPDFAFGYIDISQIDGPGQCAGWTEQTFGKAPSRARRRVRAGDILVSTVRPYLRSFAQVPPAPLPLVASTGFAVVRVSGEADQQFLYQHILHSGFIDHLTPRMTGSNYPAVSASDVEAYPISLPPLHEQRRIAEVLRSVDEAIAANRAALDQHARLIDAVFEEWSKQPFPKVALGDLLDFKNGINFEKDERADEGTLTLDVMNMFSANMTPNYESAYRISKTVPADLTLRNGDILFVRSSVKRDGVGWASLADGFNETTTFCGFIIRGRPTRSDVLSRYVVGVLRAPEYRRWLIQHSTRSALTNINQKTISSVEIPLPSLRQQRDMIEQYEAVASAASDCRTALGKLEQVRIEMASDLLSGRVRVPA